MIQITEHIQAQFERVLAASEPNFAQWLRAHRAIPRPTTLANDLDSATTIEVWLVTDHTGEEDASYRIVCSPEHRSFGYECTLEGDVPFFIGLVGSLDDALEGL